MGHAAPGAEQSVNNIRLTHVGGPTVLIEVDGWRLLTDPTFDPPGRKYKFGWGTGSQKLTGPAVAAPELGPIDAILLTHDHHDDNLDPCGREQLSSAGVEVVVMVLVREQDRVDPSELGRLDRRPGELARAGAPPERVVASGRVEGRIGEQPPPADLDQGGRPADVRDPEIGQARAGTSRADQTAAFSTAQSSA